MLLAIIVAGVTTGALADDTNEVETKPDGPFAPLPDHGPVPRIYTHEVMPEAQQAFDARRQVFAREIKQIRGEHFGSIRNELIRMEGIDRLRQMTDPAAFRPMFEVLRDEVPTVRKVVLDHLSIQGPEGQAALAWIAIHKANEEPNERDAEALFHQAISRMTTPVPDPVLREVDHALRSSSHSVAGAAGRLSGLLDVVQAIPLMMFTQVISADRSTTGDQAWIFVGKQEYFTIGLQPVAGSNVGAFQPIVAGINSGTVLRIREAVALFYRTEIHIWLVRMSSREWGRSTEDLGYDPRVWWHWYNDEYVPFKNRQARLSADADDA